MIEINLVQGLKIKIKLYSKITQFLNGFRLKKGNDFKLLNMPVVIVT